MDMKEAGLAMAVAFAIQQLLELLGPVIAAFPQIASNEDQRKALIKILAVLFGLGAAYLCGDCLAIAAELPGPLPLIVTAFALAGGTEGVNTVMKFGVYAKENKKAVADNTRNAPKLQLHAHV